jgi:hypothetical protein
MSPLAANLLAILTFGARSAIVDNLSSSSFGVTHAQ